MIFESGEQSTLRQDVSFEGIGIHTGAKCSLLIHPAEAGSGIVFLRDRVRIPATPSHVVDTSSRGTTLGLNGTKVVCIEHLLAALAGLGIDNIVCEVIGPELPALDGSARVYVESFNNTGLLNQGRERTEYRIEQLECVSRGDAVLTGSPSDSFQAGFLLRYDNPMIGMSTRQFSGGSDAFVADLASARTFGLWSEAEQLRAAGLALGASEENALIVYEDRVRPALRFPDEFVRHKLLDMLGDLALTGGAIHGTLFGVATGHWANVEMARRIRKE